MRLMNKKVTTTDARQGSPTRVNLRVLIVSLVVLVTLFLAIYYTFYGTVSP
jgi:hypothetical protein